MASTVMYNRYEFALERNEERLMCMQTPDILAYLFQEEHFTLGELSDVNKINTTRGKAREIYTLLKKKGGSAFNTFHQALCESNQQQLADEVDKDLVDPRHCSVDNLKRSVYGFEPQRFDITTKNVNGNNFFCPPELIGVKVEESTVDGEGQISVEIFNGKDGAYQVEFKPTKEGKHIVTIDGEELEHGTVDVIKKFEPVRSFGSRGSLSGQFFEPDGITVDNENYVLVADTSNHRVQVFNADGQYIRELGGERIMNKPTGITVNKDNNIIVSNNYDLNVQVFTSDGRQCIRSIGQGIVTRACGVCVSSDGNIVVCSSRDMRGVKMFSEEGQLLSKDMFPAQEEDESPQYVTYSNGKYFVTYYLKHFIRVYDDNGRFVDQFSFYGDSHNQSSGPIGLTVYREHYLLVCDQYNYRVQVLTLQGEFLGSFGSRGFDRGEMCAPTDITVLSDGRTVMLTDWSSDCVHIWRN